MTHEERLELIHRPFFITYIGPSYPWGGCAVADNFFGSGEWAERARPTDASDSYVRDGVLSYGHGHGSLAEVLRRNW